MARRPFDPARMSGARRAPKPSTLTVGQLAGMVSDALSAGLPETVRVVGEVSGLRSRTHLYFTLKDADAVVNCVLFASTARRLPFQPEDGREVIASGRVEFYAPFGRVSLVVQGLEPVGAGALDVAFRKLCAELRELGWFDEARKRPLPLFPRRLAIVTSGTGAALQDVLDTVRRRAPFLRVSLVDVRVQGEGAAREVERAVRWLGARHASLGIDVVLVTRGGGSTEDLWAFNDRALAESILHCEVPVVAAIGHETDTTIAELVADVRAATPTQAAMRIAPDRQALLEQLGAWRSRLSSLLARRLREERRHLDATARHLIQAQRSLVSARESRLERVARRLGAASPSRRLARRRERLSAVRERLPAALRGRLASVSLDWQASQLERSAGAALARRRDRLEQLVRRLEGVSPMRVLGRGYSVTLGADGRAVRDASTLSADDVLRTRLAKGSVESRVVRTDDPE